MASATAPRIPLCAHSGFPILSIFDASTHDYTHARLVSSPCYPRPYLHDLFMPAPYFPPLCLISSTRSCAVLSFCVSLTQAAQAFSIIIDTPPEPLRCARCSSLYLYLYPSLSTLCSCPASRRFRDGPAHSGCTRIPPSSLSSSVRLKNVLFVCYFRAPIIISPVSAVRLSLSPLRPLASPAGYVSVVYLMYARLLD